KIEALTPIPAFETFSGTADIYIYFIERGIKLLKPGGRLGFITSGTFARANFASAFRVWLPHHARFEKLLNFGENQPFADAEMVYPTISILIKGTALRTFRSLFVHGTIPEGLEAAMSERGIDCHDSALEQREWTFQPTRVLSLAQMLLDRGHPLSGLKWARIYRGVLTGLNEAFVIDDQTRALLVNEDPNSARALMKLIDGEDLRPWYHEDRNKWLIFTRRGVRLDDYPSVKAHLEKFRERLEPRPKDWDETDVWQGRKPGAYQWYEIQDSVDYHEVFGCPKVFWPDIAKLPRFSLDEGKTFGSNTVYILPLEPGTEWILAILQSRCSWFSLSQISTPLRLRGGLWQYRCFRQFVERLPIPHVTDDDRRALTDLVLRATEIAQERCSLHDVVRNRILIDLGGQTDVTGLNQRLSAWYTLPPDAFRKEVKNHFKRNVPLKEGTEWEEALMGWQGSHVRMTEQLIEVEVEVNDRVYRLFGLSAPDVRLLEDHMREAHLYYPFGEV
ncbi:MAG: Eco57I restriction-modification methylase domain-containing protein, partial [Acidobacteriota bacterium]